MIRKVIAIAVCFIAVVTQAAAQGLIIELDGGLQGTQYPLTNGRNKPLPGGSFGLLYAFPLGNHWGLLTGITGGVYRTQATLPDGVVFSNYQVDDEGSAFQYSMKTKGYTETQQFFAGGIPLLLQYHTAGAGSQWYINAGGKVLFPSSAGVAIKAQQVTLSGYYPDYNVNISNLPQHGFGTIDNWNASSTTELKPAAALSAATGLSFRLSRSTRLYTGLYIEYGLTDLKSKTDSMPLVTYSSTGVNGVQANGILNTLNAGQVKLLSLGLQVRLNFGRAGTKTAAPSNPATPAIQSSPTTAPNPANSSNPSNLTISDDEAKVIQRPVVFGVLDETNLLQIQKDHLDDVAAIMMQYPDIRISIVGHICNSGTETEKAKTGIARARAVARYLRSKGIDRSRMNISAVDKSDPVLPYNPGANFQNRRVVITIL
ncbi:MAG TPA: OmpA family protein [Puia sp.]|nr:OmpA family protein [Puia sp.]